MPWRGVAAGGTPRRVPGAGIIIGNNENSSVRLQDIATVKDSVANEQIASWYNQQRAVILAVQRQPGSNTVAVANAVHQLLPELTQKLPGGAQLHVIYATALTLLFLL